MTITIIGLGPGAIDDLSLKAWRTLENAHTVYLRTSRHPCVPHLPQNATYHSFDDLYETFTDFADVYAAITARILEAAQAGDVVYAVPGDPLVGESTAARIVSAAHETGLSVQIINGISFIEPMLSLLQIDALDGLQIVDGLILASQHHPALNPAFSALIGQVYSRQVASDVKLTLMNQYPDDHPVKLIHRAGTTDVHIEALPLYEIDHSPHIDHLTSLYVPELGALTSFESFQETIAHLRAPEGCPWDREQTHQSLRPYLLEEAHEVLEAIDAGDMDNLCAELGDLLLQVVLHVQIATEYGDFQMADVIRHVNEKMIRRHPHVWGDVDVQGDAEKVVANWEDIKKAEKNGDDNVRKSILDGVPRGLPALLVAHKYQEKAAKVGFDWPDISGVEQKIREELDEIFSAPTDTERASEIGDVMFVLVNYLRWLGVHDPESILREINAKFYRRFTYIEEQTSINGDKPLTDYTLAEMDALWDEAKAKGL